MAVRALDIYQTARRFSPLLGHCRMGWWLSSHHWRSQRGRELGSNGKQWEAMGSNGEQWEAMGKDQQEQQSSYSIADTLPFKQSNFRWHSRSRQSMMGQQQRCLSLAKNRWNMIFLSQPYSLKSSHDRLFLKHRVSWRNSVCKLRKLQKLVGSLPLFFAASLRRTPGGRRPLLLGRCWLRGRYRGGRGILSKQWFLQRKSWTNQIKTGLKNVKEIEMALSERSSILHFNAKATAPCRLSHSWCVT